VSRLAPILAALVSTAAAGTFTFHHGPLSLTFDEGTGGLVRIARGDQVLAEAGPDRSPTSFGFGPQRASTWLERLKPGRKLVKRNQPVPDTLELTIAVGEFEVVERYRLFADSPRVDRSAVLTNRGKQTVKLRAFTFRTPGLKATPDGFYRFPKQWPPRSHPFADMKLGVRRGGGTSIAPLVVQLAPDRSLLFAACADDTPHVRVEEGSGQFDVVQGIGAAGYLRPNQPQHVGFVTMQVADAAYWDALPRFWDWFDSVGVKVPADVPDWVRGAVLYSFHPGGTIGSRWTDLGGFKAATERLLPTLPKLGVTAIWILPVEHKSPYWPLDYYRFQDGLGTADEFKALVRRAHELGLKVLLDIVPHGGAPQAVHNQAHPEFMLRREDGSHLTYWLNDFARPDWQDYIARVAAHYVSEYDVDGFRIDACYGSKEYNWDPAIPYARASHARLKGGLEMVKRIRHEVKKLKPKDGAVLAEVESPRHAAVSDFQYDFGLCYAALHGWRRMPAAEYVPLLQEYLEEQKYVNPRGTIFMRYVESHDSLRSQGWYGVRGMEALYALTAWIGGVPMIYQDMEIGHSFALREINRIRREHPELSRGETLYRAARCDQPGVFTCVRRFGTRLALPMINLSRETIQRGQITFQPTVETKSLVSLPLLRPLEYAVVTPPSSVAAHRPEPRVVRPRAREAGIAETRPRPRKPSIRSSIYWRPQPAIIEEPPLNASSCPPGVRLRRVGPDYIVSNAHFTCVLRRQAGVIRELFAGGKLLAKDHDLYGDQQFFAMRTTPRIAASNDVESGIRIWQSDDGLHLAFEGQLRGFGRFEIRRPPIWYRTEYVFTDKPAFTQKWAFRTQRAFEDKTAFLAAIVQLPEADRFRFLRDGKTLADDAVGQGGPRRGQTAGGPPPDRVEFLRAGKLLFALAGLRTPGGVKPNVFVHGRQFFVTLLDGKGAAMDAGRWYQFEAEWRVAPK